MQVKKLSLVIVLGLFFIGVVSAQAVSDSVWVANKQVRASEVIGNTLYIGGDFDYIGPASGHAALLDINSGQADFDFPKIDGVVLSTASDGAGGWFVGGLFTRVGGIARQNLVHIFSNGDVDLNWNPAPDDAVRALALSGNILYIGGDFTSVGEENRAKFAAVDTITGQVTSFTADVAGNPLGSSSGAPDGRVRALALTGDSLYIAGEFFTISGVSRTNLAALDLATDSITAWNPGPDFAVFTVAPTAQSVYVGGAFTQINGQPQARLAEVDVISGQLTSWRPVVNGQVHSILVDASSVYIGGIFTTVAASASSPVLLRYGFTILDRATGAVSPVTTNVYPNYVSAFARDGNIIYLAGGFTRAGVQNSAGELANGPSGSIIGGVGRNRLAAFDVTSGQFTAWNPGAGDTVRSLALFDNNVIAGGQFTTVNGIDRKFFAAIDLSTGQPTSLDLAPTGSVTVIAQDGTSLFLSGGFNSIGGQARNYLAEFNTANGQITSWNPPATDTIPAVNALAVLGNTVYAGGDFTTVGSASRLHLAAFSKNNGQLTSWNPGADNSVLSLATSGTTIYAGGYFSSVGGGSGSTPRSRIAALTPQGTVTPWNPVLDNAVLTIVPEGNSVFIGGTFLNVNGQQRNRVAELDATTGQPTSWNPSANAAVRTIALTSDTVYLGGQFTALNNQERLYTGAISRLNGAVLPWHLEITSVIVEGIVSSGFVHDLSLFGNFVAAVGDFIDAHSSGHSYVAVARDASGTLGTCADPSSLGTLTVNGNTGGSSHVVTVDKHQPIQLVVDGIGDFIVIGILGVPSPTQALTGVTNGVTGILCFPSAFHEPANSNLFTAVSSIPAIASVVNATNAAPWSTTIQDVSTLDDVTVQLVYDSGNGVYETSNAIALHFE